MRLVDEVKSRVNILDVIGAAVKLKKAGKHYTGKCPFHTEKTGSFNVDPSKQFYHCFGCDAGGDVVKFVMEYEQVSFSEAMSRLADRASMNARKTRKRPVNQTVKSLEQAGRAVEALELAEKEYCRK